MKPFLFLNCLTLNEIILKKVSVSINDRLLKHTFLKIQTIKIHIKARQILKRFLLVYRHLIIK